jgi:peptide deformylase
MLSLVTHPAEILNKTMPNFDFDNPIMDPRDLEEQMVKLMYEENGIGLAAPQVGIEARVFTIMTRNIPEVTEPFAIFNPVILAFSEETDLGDEGCLSFPGLFFKVARSSKIIAEFLDRDRIIHRMEFTGIDARCFQHELDHLNGICFTSKISRVKLELAMSKRAKIQKLKQRKKNKHA